MADWTPDDMIGDILYALVSYIIVYSEYSHIWKSYWVSRLQNKIWDLLYIMATQTGAMGRRLSNHCIFWKKRFSSFFANGPIKFKV